MTLVSMSVLAAALWIACGVLHAGFCYAHFQRTYPLIAAKYRRDDAVKSLIMSVCGPLALLSAIIIGLCDQGWLLPFMASRKRGD